MLAGFSIFHLTTANSVICFSMRTKAKEAVTAAINLFRCGPIQAPWEPQYITDCGEAWNTLSSSPSYALLEKWDITLRIEKGNRQSPWVGRYAVAIPEGDAIITMRVTSPGTWLHELCHVANYHLGQRQGLRTFEEETVADLSAAALLYLWHPDLDGEFRCCFESIRLYADTRTPLESILIAREAAEERVALILEEV